MVFDNKLTKKMKFKDLTKAVLTAVMILSVGSIYSQNNNSGELNSSLTKFAQTIYYINSYYLDTVNNQKLIDEAISKAVSQLDPHSSYISAKDVKAMNEPLEGNFEGVGIEFSIVKDTLSVVNPIPGGPCERVGIRAGDKIVKIDSDNLSESKVTNEKVFKLLRGPKGTKVRLFIKRKGVKDILEFEVTRDKIPINSLDAAYTVNNDIIYLKLSRFAATSYQEILSALAKLNVASPKGIILDLRGNTGGFLGTAFEISNMFLEKGQTIVYTEGLRVPRMSERATGSGMFVKTPLAVLLDENSASSSEVVAGSIQDWDRGVVIGRRSFGKGLVQQMFPLSDGAQLRLTIARYHTPSGRVIQSPYEQGEITKYYQALYKRYTNGEMFSADSVKFPDSLKYKTLVKGRTVYGGGGIMPDIFIPADTSGYSEYYANIVRKGILAEFMNDKADSQREQWKREYPTYEVFDKNFNLVNQYVSELISFADKKGVKPNEKEIENSRFEIELLIKALTARTIFGSEAYYKVVNSKGDKVFERALKELTSSKR